jgi:hypothetical protein
MCGTPIFSSMDPEMRETVRQSTIVPRRQPSSIRSILVPIVFALTRLITLRDSSSDALTLKVLFT